MSHRALRTHISALAAAALFAAACAEEAPLPPDAGSSPSAPPLLSFASSGDDARGDGRAWEFQPLLTSTACTNGGNPEKPFALPPGFDQVVFAREGDGGTAGRDAWDMNTQNETGAQPGRYLYRPNENGPGGVSVTDLRSIRQDGPIVTSDTRMLAHRADWERLDGIAWTPWGTIIVAEEATTSAAKDPALPAAKGGHVYEIDPTTGAPVLRAAVGSRAHEGLRFDPDGNLYGISEASRPTGGYIYKFVPDRRSDLSSGQLYALKIVEATGDRTGRAVWVALDREQSKLDSDKEATRVGATGYDRPEDVESATSTGRYDPWVLFVAVTNVPTENRVLAIDLRPEGKKNDGDAYVYDFVRVGLNAPVGFEWPDNVALDKAGTLYIAEDPPGNPIGADIWVAKAPRKWDHESRDPQRHQAESVVRFASLTDCASEPTGIYFDVHRQLLFVNVQHRGGDTRDEAVMIFPARGSGDDGERD